MYEIRRNSIENLIKKNKLNPTCNAIESQTLVADVERISIDSL